MGYSPGNCFTDALRNWNMETFGLIGFIFGLSGLSFAITATAKLANLKKEVDALRKDLEDLGVLK